MPPRDYYLPSRQLVSQNEAALVERATIPRSQFRNSWTRKTTFDAGYLVPFLIDEILPGDHMRYNVTAYVRLSTPLFPLFDNQRVDTFFFFVPTRLIWENWKRFMGEQDTPTDTIDYTIPQLVSTAGGYVVGTIFDHMGLPTTGQIPGANTVSHNVLPLRAYNIIWNEWFRDENIVSQAPRPQGNGPDTLTWYELRKRAKAHDYFTSALPWPQKFTAPSIGLTGTAPVLGIGKLTQTFPDGPLGTVYETSGITTSYTAAAFVDGVAGNNAFAVEGDGGGFPNIVADLSLNSGIAINTFRQAFLIQQLLERDARGGTRYIELIKSHFGVTSPDFRLQRPEYVGGGQTPLSLTPIAQTAPSAGVPVGALGAAGTAAGSHSASYAATEHGYIIGLINVRSEISYQQGLHKMWSRLTRYDFYWPALAGLGEQAILRKEIYVTGASANDDAVFGYQERWQEYRTRTSEVTGMFRSNETGTLDAWHLAQQFSVAPTLSDAFLAEDPPMARVLAAGSAAAGQQYLADILIQRTATRAIPTYGTPVTLGRF